MRRCGRGGGGGALRYTAQEGVLRQPGQEEDGFGWHGAVDATFERVQLRSEYRSMDYDNYEYDGYYVQGGVRLAKRLTVNGQAEFGDVKVLNIPFLGQMDLDYIRDYAVGVKWAFRSDLVLKVEGHSAEGYAFEEDKPALMNPPTKGTYFLTSLSFVF